MQVQIFKHITTEEILSELEEESKTYEGLYVDMSVAKERKYVKDKASLVSDMLKKLDRARIDESKDYKAKVEAEAGKIKSRLELINLPFTALIDKHKKERADALAKEKAEQAAKELEEKILVDHDAAIMEDKVRKFEAVEAERLEKEERERVIFEAANAAKEKAENDAHEAIERAEAESLAAIDREIEAKKQVALAEQARLEAVERQRVDAELAEQRRVKAEADAKIAAEQAAENSRLQEVERQKAEAKRLLDEQVKREANKKHIGSIRKDAKEALILRAGLSEDQAKKVVLAIHNKAIPSITINY